MSTIWRFPLEINDGVTLAMPAGAQLLSVGSPRGDSPILDLWAVVDPAAEKEKRDFRVVGTGNPMPDDCGSYVGTASSHEGMLVWHVFEATA